MTDASRHIPVLETTVMQLLSPKAGATVLDCTLGLGGHALRFLEAIGPDGTFIGIDADETNLRDATKRLKGYERQVLLHHANFGDVATLRLPQVDLLFADLGLSSPHIDEPERGFSFRADGPLDLRFDRTSGKPASELIEEADENQLVYVLRSYGEIRDVRHLIEAMRAAPPQTTQELRAQAEKVYTWKAPKLLPQIFQALRIWANDELGTLQRLLDATPSLMKPDAYAAFISYHSLEDRLVKHAFKALCVPEKDPVTGRAVRKVEFELLHPKGVQPSEEESASNPRARSARLRILHRLS